MPVTADLRDRLLATAASLHPRLHERIVRPADHVRAVADARGFQGWRVEPAGPADGPLGAGDAVTYDFGEHLVGYFAVRVEPVGVQDAPARLRFVFAEVPAELGEPFDPYLGQLSRAWLQDEVVNLDLLPAVVALPRRYAMRFVRVEVIDTSRDYRVRLSDPRVTAVTSADDAVVPPLPHGVPNDLRAIDAVSVRTLRNCMQTVFEDGPKRDRRLWMGDLRLQAMTNYVTFRDFGLVKRCLLLFAALPLTDDPRAGPGIVNGDIYERPAPHHGKCSILDYAALFADTVLAYAQASGDWATARDVWPVCVDQLQLLKYTGADGLFHDPGGWWLFVDWQESLDKQAAEHATLTLMLRRTIELGRALASRFDDVGADPSWDERLTALERAGRTLIDPATGRVTSGPRRQVSWASQAWFTVSGLLSPREAAAALAATMDDPAAVRPGGPYGYHTVIEAMLLAGLREPAAALLRTYWGAMIAAGGTTFFEVFDPTDDRRSPYGNHLINSYCHAWSCTPAYFIRSALFPT